MSTTKVNNSTPVGHASAQLMKLGAISASGASASVVGIADSGGVGTPTEQYLQNQNLPNNTMVAQTAVEMAVPAVMAVAAAPEAGTVFSANMGMANTEYRDGYKSADIGHKLESYEKVIEASEVPVEKTTQGFG